MAKTKEIQRRLKSINNIQKITKAMEMVAAAKMRRAVEAVVRTRTYANLSWEIALNLATISRAKQESLHPLLVLRSEVKRVAVIVISSNRGLCGGFNANLLSKVKQSVKKYHFQNDELLILPEFILVGRKARSLVNLGYKVAADFTKSELTDDMSVTESLAELAITDFLNGHYDKVLVAYTDFINPMKQTPRIKQLLPIDMDSKDDYLGLASRDPRIGVTKNFLQQERKEHLHSIQDSLFEPSPYEVMDAILPKLIRVQLRQALLEANASEHSARMAAMRQASDAARDMADELKLSFNKARQASITAEIAEISAGASALIAN